LERCPDVVWSGEDLIWSGDGQTFLRGVGVRYLTHSAFEEGFKRILQHYRPRKHYLLCLFLPCSYGKPYSHSFIHFFIRKVIWESGCSEYVHEVIVSNAGVIPRELEEYYPYCCYDWNPKYETPEVKREYVRVLRRRVARYMRAFQGFYECFAAFLRWDSESWCAVRLAAEDLGIEVTNLAPQKVPMSELEMLQKLYPEEADLVLVTDTALKSLMMGIQQLVSGCLEPS